MNYIITWSDAKFIPIFKEFLVSLFTLGKFKGKLIYYYYYEENIEENIEFTNLITKKFDVIVFRKPKEHHMNQTIYIGLQDVIFSNFFNKKDYIAIYDTDFWFQDDINTLFDLKPRRFAVSPELNNPIKFELDGSNLPFYYNRPHIKEFYSDFPEKEKNDVIRYLDELAKTYNMINSGFLYGKYPHIRVFIKWINKYYNEYPKLHAAFSADQFLLNYYLRRNLDDITQHIYNYCIFCNQSLWKVNEDNRIITHKNEIAKAIHLQRFKQDDHADHSFLTYHPEYKEKYSEIFKEE